MQSITVLSLLLCSLLPHLAKAPPPPPKEPRPPESGPPILETYYKQQFKDMAKGWCPVCLDRCKAHSPRVLDHSLCPQWCTDLYQDWLAETVWELHLEVAAGRFAVPGASRVAMLEAIDAAADHARSSIQCREPSDGRPATDPPGSPGSNANQGKDAERDVSSDKEENSKDEGSSKWTLPQAVALPPRGGGNGGGDGSGGPRGGGTQAEGDGTSSGSGAGTSSRPKKIGAGTGTIVLDAHKAKDGQPQSWLGGSTLPATTAAGVGALLPGFVHKSTRLIQTVGDVAPRILAPLYRAFKPGATGGGL